MLFVDGIPELPELLSADVYVRSRTNNKAHFYSDIKMHSMFDAIEDLYYMRDQFVHVCRIMRNHKIYLIDEIWPKPATNKKLEEENPDLKKLKDILKDDKLMKLMNINASSDEVMIHLANPGKHKPTLNFGPKISLAKLQTQLSSIGSLNLKEGNLLTQI